MSKDYTNEAYNALQEDYNEDLKKAKLSLSILKSKALLNGNLGLTIHVKNLETFINKWATK